MHSPHSPLFFNHSPRSLALRVLAHYPHLLSLLSSLRILSHCAQQMPARASFQKILAAMIWCVCAHSAKSVCAHTNLSRVQSVQTRAENRVRKLAHCILRASLCARLLNKLEQRAECTNLCSEQSAQTCAETQTCAKNRVRKLAQRLAKILAAMICWK